MKTSNITPSPRVSPSTGHPLDLPAVDLAAGIRAGAISAEAVVTESLRRAREIALPFNPFTVIREDEALQAARRADQAVTRGEATGFLHGVPFAAKDLTPTAGDLTTRGSWSTGDWVPQESALCVQRLEAAGAILVAKTTTPEFAHSSFTYSPRWGVTTNPWDPSRTSGGSSGGSAVAVATGVVPFAEGTDMGGSVRIPAAFCGVVGLKPSLGRIPMTILPSQFDNISHFGPLARTVADAVAFMTAAAGPSDDDISSVPLPFDQVAAMDRRPLAGRRFALSLDLGYYAVAPEVTAVIQRAAERLRAAGAVVDDITLPWTRAVNDQWFDIWCVFMAAYFGDAIKTSATRMDPAVVGMIERGYTLGAAAYKRIDILRTALWRDIAAMFRHYDALLCPTCAVEAPAATAIDDDFMATRADGRFAGLDMTCAFNLIPQCPALSLPAGRTGNGLPVGLQIVGHRYADEAVLALAAGVERLLAVKG